ncbi:MAG: M13 family metallopeptidase N-terminal domain-containing protein, partial [Pseudomonadota bacterium]
MISLSRRTLTASVAALLTGCATKEAATTTTTAATTTAPPKPPAAIGAWGVDLNARDLTVKPGDDFFHYANGTWLKNNPIPADRTRWGSFAILAKNAEEQVKAILEEVAAAPAGAPGSGPQKLKDYYTSYLNVDAINAAGVAPMQADLATINAARNHVDIIRLMMRVDMPVAGPIGLGVDLDAKNPNRYITTMGHGGLSLPDRDYYLLTDQNYVDTRNAFKAHVAQMLTLGGQSGAAAKANAILALETQIAQRHWPRADRRDLDKTYNLKTRADIRALNTHFPWDEAFQAAEMGDVQEVVVAELSAMGPLSQLFLSTPVSTWKSYLAYHYII